jgi:predicted permease
MKHDWRKYVSDHLPKLSIRAERERDIVDELAQQLEAAFDAAKRAGENEVEAFRRAAAEVPDWDDLAVTLERIESQRAESVPGCTPPAPRRGVLTNVVQDFRHAARRLLRAPAFSFVAALTLALGLALATTAFSIIDSVLIRPLPYPEADRLVLVKATVPPDGRETAEMTLPDARDIEASGIFEAVAAVVSSAGTTTLTDPPSRLEGLLVSPTLFSTLRLTAAPGRVFMKDDGAPGATPVVVIGHGFWRRLGSPGDIIGRLLSFNEVPYTIVGVAPPGFRIDVLGGDADVFLPLTADNPFATNRGLRGFRVIARLKPGTSIEQASAAISALGATLAEDHPSTNLGRTFLLDSLQEGVVRDARPQLWLVAALVALVLLVAAVNLAGLLLTRAVARLREVSLRIALGASRWRLMRESLAEGLLISAFGTMAGGLLARVAIEAIKTAPGIALPRLAEAQLDLRPLAALFATGTVIACIVGVVPLLSSRRARATSELRTGHETAGRSSTRLRTVLLIGQTACAFVLLATTMLLATSLRTLLSQPLGFETTEVVTLRVAVPETRYPSREATALFFAQLLDELRAHPSVRGAGLISNLPLAGNTGSTLSIRGREDTPLALRPTVGWHWTSPGYFSAMGMAVVRGRDFTADDVTRTSHVTVINETAARLHFGGEDPIGKQVYFGGFGPGGPPEWHEVIGVVGDVRHRGLEADADARAYDLFGQHWGRTVSLAIRTASAPEQVARLVRQLLAERDPRLAVFSIRTTADLVEGAVASRRMLLLLVTTFAIVGLIIASVGLYGSVSYAVAQRTRELGVRLALGATTRQIRRMVLGSGLLIVGIGIAVGLLGLLGLRRPIEAQLFGVTALNPAALTAAVATMLAAATLACLVPARRATRINPVDALRAE